VLVDLGGIVVHVMQPAVRSYYNLEELWGAAGGPPAARRAAHAA
jgi:ribosome-associated protein